MWCGDWLYSGLQGDGGNMYEKEEREPLLILWVRDVPVIKAISKKCLIRCDGLYIL